MFWILCGAGAVAIGAALPAVAAEVSQPPAAEHQLHGHDQHRAHAEAADLADQAPDLTAGAVVEENVRHVTNVPGSTGGHAVVESGRLYVGAYGMGMRIFDVENPANPEPIGEYFPGPQSASDLGARADAVPDAAVFDDRHIAILNGTSRASSTQQSEFLDVTDPANPELLWRFTGANDGEAHNGDIADARRWWIPSGGSSGNGLRIYDLNPVLGETPAAPAKLFAGNPVNLWNESPYRGDRPVGPGFSHTHDVEIYLDRQVKVGEDEFGSPIFEPRDILLMAEGGSYLGAGNTGSIFVVDITDPTAPVVLNRWRQEFDDPDGHPIRYYHEVQFLDGDPSVMIVTDEDLHNGCEAGGVYSVQVSDDLTEATKLSQWFNGTGTPAPNCSAHVISTKGPYVFMGSYNAGLQVIDYSDPAAPTRAGQFIFPNQNSWGALYHEGYVYTGDFGPRGLDVFEFIAEPIGKAFVKAANPGTRTTGGVAETGCRNADPYGPTNGTDGLIVPIPEYARDGRHTLRALGSSPAPYDLDIWFHTGTNCTSMGSAGGNDSTDAVDRIPQGATMASIDLYIGPAQWVYAQVVAPVSAEFSSGE